MLNYWVKRWNGLVIFLNSFLPLWLELLPLIFLDPINTRLLIFLFCSFSAFLLHLYKLFSYFKTNICPWILGKSKNVFSKAFWKLNANSHITIRNLKRYRLYRKWIQAQKIHFSEYARLEMYSHLTQVQGGLFCSHS